MAFADVGKEVLVTADAASPRLEGFNATTFVAEAGIPADPFATSVTSVAISPDRAWLAVSGLNTSGSDAVKVYNTGTWVQVSLTAPQSGASKVVFSPNGGYLAAARGGTPALDVYTAPDFNLVGSVPSFSGSGSSVMFSPDNTLLAVGRTDSPYLLVLSTADWTTVFSSTSEIQPAGIAFSPDGGYMAVVHYGTSGLTVYTTSDWAVVSGTPTFTAGMRAVAFSLDGAKLVVGFTDAPGIQVYNTADWSLVTGTPAYAAAYAVAFNSDGSRMAVGIFESPYLKVLNTSDYSAVPGTPNLGGTCVAVAYGGAYVSSFWENFRRCQEV